MNLKVICDVCGAETEAVAREGQGTGHCSWCGRPLVYPALPSDSVAAGEKRTRHPDFFRRMISAHLQNTKQVVQLVEGRLTPDEEHRVAEAVARAEHLAPDAQIAELEACAAEMESAVTIMLVAMTRP